MGTGLGLLIGVSEPAALAVLPASIIIWGAARTAQYRPAEVKAQITANLAKQQATVQPGTVWEVIR